MYYFSIFVLLLIKNLIIVSLIGTLLVEVEKMAPTIWEPLLLFT
jgi:hypothetical protein